MKNLRSEMDQVSLEIKRILDEAMEKSNINSNELARLIGKDGSFIYDLRSGRKSTVSAGALEDIESCLPHLERGVLARLMSQKKSGKNTGQVVISRESSIVDGRKIGIFGRYNLKSRGIIMDATIAEIAVPKEISGSFGCIMPDQSMEPRFFQGEVLIIDETRPITPKCFCLLQIPGAASAEGFVRQFISREESGDVVTKTLNPEKTYSTPQSVIISICRIVANYEPNQ